MVSLAKPIATILAISFLLALIAAPGIDASGGGKGVDESGECDAEDGADGSCDASSGIEGETAAATVQEAECVDKEPRCADWAAEGECEENPDYMLGE
mgnify:CR=1 FL=1